MAGLWAHYRNCLFHEAWLERPRDMGWFQLSMEHFTLGSLCHGKQLLKTWLHGLSCVKSGKDRLSPESRIFSLLAEFSLMSEVMTTQRYGYRTILFQICLRSQDIESQMSPSVHLCPWFYSFDPSLILRRRAPRFSAPWCQSQLFSGALNVCIHLWCDPCGGSVCVGLSGEKCLKQSLRVNSVVLREKAGWLGFSGD